MSNVGRAQRRSSVEKPSSPGHGRDAELPLECFLVEGEIGELLAPAR
jgi:hypothetical protein